MPTGTEREFSAVWAPLKAGALLRLTLEGAALSVAWSHPGRGEWAVGVGIAAEGEGTIVWRAGAPAGCPGPWFGGWSFDGVERWVLPRVLAWWSGGRTFAAGFGEDPDGDLARISEVEPVLEVPRAVATFGNRAKWSELVERALREIAAGSISKVVLARQIAVEAEAPFEERRVLKALEARFPTCRTFLLRNNDGSAFVGASPETLCQIDGRTITTEALAGTGQGARVRPLPGSGSRAGTVAEQGDALLSSEKDRREHAWVVEQIIERLGPLTVHLEVADQPRVKQFGPLLHLCTAIRGELRDGVAAMKAARALHPTPAVAGAPRAVALEFIREHEGFDRGWYAGAIGARSESSLELWVGIRSAWIKGGVAIAYAGAGVVAGSTADGEWTETARKAEAILGALGVSDG